MALPDLTGMRPISRKAYEKLCAYKAADGGPLFPSLHDHFKKEMPKTLKRLKANLDKEDRKETYEDLHKMKGVALTMGALRMKELTEFVLDMCSDGSVFEEPFLIREIEMEIGLYLSAVRALEEF